MEAKEHRYRVLTRVGPGTPMGELMRQYWIPAIMSDELVADGDPVRLKLLGEDLIAFRTTSGKVGIMDQRCPHRVASLFYGRNEEDGIRCVYHGWKFDAEGKCVDQGNIPVEQQFCERTPAKAYPTREQAGVIWAYMGHAKELPPMLPMRVLEAEKVIVRSTMLNCSWLQGLEGDIDTSHAGLLHSENRHLIAKIDASNATDPELIMFTNTQPEYKSSETEYGTIYGAVRPANDKQDYWRIGHYLFPFYSMTAAPPLGSVTVGASVPMDDTHTMRFQFADEAWNRFRMESPMMKTLGTSRVYEFLPNTTDWYGRWRLKAQADNDYMIDREKQRHGGSYSGIHGVQPQDTAVTESMGGVVDHSWENLAPSDLMIVKTRNRILGVLEEVSQGKAAPGIKDPEIYASVTGGYANLPKGNDWLKAYADYTKHNIRQVTQAAE